MLHPMSSMPPRRALRVLHIEDSELDHQLMVTQLERAGLAPAEILRVVTVNNAAYLGHAHELGRVAPGFRADLLLLSQNPLDDLAALRQPRWTMVGGMVMWETRQAQP